MSDEEQEHSHTHTPKKEHEKKVNNNKQIEFIHWCFDGQTHSLRLGFCRFILWCCCCCCCSLYCLYFSHTLLHQIKVVDTCSRYTHTHTHSRTPRHICFFFLFFFQWNNTTVEWFNDLQPLFAHTTTNQASKRTLTYTSTHTRTHTDDECDALLRCCGCGCNHWRCCCFWYTN